MNFPELVKCRYTGVMVEDEIEGLPAGYCFDIMEANRGSGDSIGSVKLRAWQDNISDGKYASRAVIEALVPYDESYMEKYEQKVRKSIKDPLEKAAAVAPLMEELSTLEDHVRECARKLAEAQKSVERYQSRYDSALKRVEDIKGFIGEVMED